MSVRAKYVDGVFKPLEEVDGLEEGAVYRVLSSEEIAELAENLAWLKASEDSFAFWDNAEDDVFNEL